MRRIKQIPQQKQTFSTFVFTFLQKKKQQLKKQAYPEGDALSFADKTSSNCL
jgi:hypothetical protein